MAVNINGWNYSTKLFKQISVRDDGILSGDYGVGISTNTTTSNIAGNSSINQVGGISSGDNTITVLSGASFGAGQTIRIADEYIVINSVTNNDLSVQRGQFTTGPSAHADSTPVIGYYVGIGEQSNYPDIMTSLKSNIAGKEFYDFSTNGTSWDTFPVTGFTVTPNIHEFHTAVKGPRYFRVRFENTEGISSSSFRVNTYFGTFRQGNLPLDQTIGPDSDSTVVRAVGIGQEPNNSYTNIKKDGTAFLTTTNLGGTLTTASYNSSYTGAISVEDTSSFEQNGISGGYIYIGSEFIQYDQITDSTTINTVNRGLFGTSPANIGVSSIVGEAYASDILNLDGYTQVATKATCSNNGRYRFQWFTDSNASDIIRTITPPYFTNNGYDYLSAPNFGPYVRYVFANTEGTSTTDLFFTTEFYTKSVSAQVLTLDSTLISNMTSNLTRSILVGKNDSGNFSNVPITSQNNLRVAIREPLTAFGQIKNAEETTQISEYYNYNINPRRIKTYKLITGVSTSYSAGSFAGTDLYVDYQADDLGVVDSILVGTSSRGSGYAIDDEINILAGDSNATAIIKSITTDGAVLGISLNAGGSNYTTSGASISIENNMIKLSSGISTNSKAISKTISTCKYQTGTGVVSRFTIIYDTKNAGNEQYIGIGDDNDGYFVGCSGTDFGVLRRQNGSDFFTTQSDFNIDILDGSNSTTNPSGINLDTSTGNVFQIKYQWLGFGAITFSIENSNNGIFEPFNIIKYANLQLIPSVFNPTFPIQMECTNNSGTSVNIFSASCMAALEGKKYYNNVIFTANTTDNFIAIQNNIYYKNKINKTTIVLSGIDIANNDNANNAASKTFTFYLNPILTGASFTDLDNDTSVAKIATSAADLYSSGGTIIRKLTVGAASSTNIPIVPGNIVLNPGDILYVQPGVVANTSIDISWIEDQ